MRFCAGNRHNCITGPTGKMIQVKGKIIMIDTVDISEQVRGRLVGLGLSEDAAARVTACADVEPGHDGTCRETITMGYPVVKKGFERLKDAAITNMPAGGIREMLDDMPRLATFLDSGMRATPAAKRLELPAWVEENSNARRNEKSMGKAKAIARAAADEADNG